MTNRNEHMGMSMQEKMDGIEYKIELICLVLSQTPDDDPYMPSLLAALGSEYEARYDLFNEAEDIDKAIENQSIALSITSGSDSEQVALLNLLGRAYTKRFQRIGEVDDIEEAIEYQSLTVALAPDGHPCLPVCLSNLGVAHRLRYQRLGELNDLERSIECITRAVALTPDGHPHMPNHLTSLGVSHRDRYKRLGKLTDLEKAVDCGNRAALLTPNGHSHLPSHLMNLGVSHSQRYERLGELADLEKSIECETRAAALTPDWHPNLPSHLINLGVSHSHRYERLGELNDLEKAIECDTRAVKLTPDGHPHLPAYLTNLGVSHHHRCERLGELSDLEKAIEFHTCAVVSTPEGHPDLPRRLANLGVSRRYRYERLGELSDLEKAVECDTRAVSLTLDGHPHLPAYLMNLGVSHSQRYGRLGELADLEKAVECETHAAASTPDGHPDLPRRLANLGVSHIIRYKRLGELSDLEKAIECDTRAVTLTPDDHPHLPAYLTNLGAYHNYRYERMGELSDLDKGTECNNRAVTLTPDGHPDFPARLINLGGSHTHRYRRLGNLADLEKAIKFHARVFALLPDGHPNLLLSNFNFALTYLTHYTYSGDPYHLQVSLNAFRSASQAPTGSPRAKFCHAWRWATYSSLYDPLNPIEAYQITITLLPQFVWHGVTTHQRYHDLATTQSLAVNAALAAIRSSDFLLALEWLEQTRCVVWSQSLMLRTPLDRLKSDHPTLAARLQTVSNQLHSASSPSRESQALYPGSFSMEQIAQEHRRLAMEYDDLIAQARRLHGFADFLQPMKAAGLVCAARIGPVAVINCQKDRCDALLILLGQDDIHHVPLHDFTGQDAKAAHSHMRKSLAGKRVRERGVKEKRPQGQADKFGTVLATLWHKVVKPVLDFLGYMSNAQTDKLPHITWCPTGAISFLPLHAAGDYDQPRSRVFDHVISSYTPTVTALLTSTPTLLNANSRVLAIGQEATPGRKPLPETTRELECIQTHAHNIVRYTQLKNEQATTSAVLDAMEQCDWVHLACHAHQNVNDPTKSGFFLHDGTLDLAAINRRSFKSKGLAFLSACQTATGDEDLPDEAIHLASAMLMAGYSSVIATMWSVFDADAPVVADKVYEQLMRDRKLGNGEAGKALHKAVEELRGRVGEKAFERWVPYIHIGS